MPQANRSALLLPFGTSFEEWKAMIVALQKADAQPAFAGRAKVACRRDGHIFKANIAFLKALGMATADSSESKISLTKVGVMYAQALVSGNRAVQHKVLAECAGRAFRPIARFCELTDDDLNFDRLFLQIKFLANLDDAWGQHRDTSDNDRRDIYIAISIMVATGMLDKSYLPVEEEAVQKTL